MSSFMLFRSRTLFFGAAVVLVFLGNGCLRKTPSVSSPVDPVSGLTILVGDRLIVSQAVVEKDHAVPAQKSIRVTTNIPRKTGSIDWQFTLDETKTASSTTHSGSVDGIALNTAHTLVLPGSWMGSRHLLGERAALWLADDEYQELVATKQTTIDPDLRSEEWRTVVSSVPEAKRALAALSQLALEAEQKMDTAAVKQVGEAQQKMLRLNGKETLVPVRIVKNWYGTFTILDKREDPLVLSFALDPQVDPKRFSLNKKDETTLASLLNYQITALTTESLTVPAIR
jgi:hypothetical protein